MGLQSGVVKKIIWSLCHQLLCFQSINFNWRAMQSIAIIFVEYKPLISEGLER